MSKAASLERAVLDWSILRNEYFTSLSNILDSINSSSVKEIQLVVDPEFSCRLSHLVNSDAASSTNEEGIRDDSGEHWMLKHNVNSNILELSQLSESSSASEIIYCFLLTPNPSSTKVVADWIKISQSLNGGHKCHLIYVPKINPLCSRILSECKVAKHILSVKDLPVGFMPVDNDILSLSLSNVMTDVYLNGDNSCLDHLAHSISKLESTFGEIHNIKLKGNLSADVWQKVIEGKANVARVAAPPTKSIFADDSTGIETLIMIDRTVDIASMLVTPLTYEGLVDELIGIDHGFSTIPVSYVQDDDKEVGKTNDESIITVSLNSDDELYSKLRDEHVEVLGNTLQIEATRIRQLYNTFRETSTEASVSEVHDFVKKMPQLKQNYQSLTKHVNMVTAVDEAVKQESFRESWKLERTILEGLLKDNATLLGEIKSSRRTLESSLRLLMLQSIVVGGYDRETFTSIQDLLHHEYGSSFTLDNLEKLGLLKVKSSSSFLKLAELLNLVVPNVNVESQEDIAYVTSGYAPLSIKLVENILTYKSWKESPIRSALKLLPGPTAELSQVNRSNSHKPAVILVCLVGGASYVELAALRSLSKRFKNIELVLLTTSLFGGNRFCKSLMHSS